MLSPITVGLHCLFLLFTACYQTSQDSNFDQFIQYVVSILSQPHWFSFDLYYSSPLHPQNLKGSQYKLACGNQTQKVSSVCNTDGKIQELGASCFQVLKPFQKDLSKTSGFSLVLVCKGFKLLSLELSPGNNYMGTVLGWDSPIL